MWRDFLASMVLFLFVGDSVATADNRAVETINVGDPRLNVARLAEYDNAFHVTQTLVADGRVTSPGIWTDQLRMRTVNGRRVWVRTQGLSYFNGLFLNSVNVFDPATLAPISDHQHGNDRTVEDWSFDGIHVTGHTAANEAATPDSHQFDLAAPAFDMNCCMRSLILATLPLRAGATIVIPSAALAPGDPTTVTFHVLRRERTRAGFRGMVDAWVVSTDLPNPGGGELRFWIMDRPPFVVRFTVTAGPGHPYTQLFEMF